MGKELQIASSHLTKEWNEKEKKEFVTIRVAEQLFGIPVLSVQDVLRGLKVTQIPLAAKEIAGSLNLRGRIVTAVYVRECLGLPSIAVPVKASHIMSVVVEHKSEFFSLIVDSVGEVISISHDEIEQSPANLSGRWKEVSLGVYKLQHELLIMLNIQKLLKL